MKTEEEARKCWCPFARITNISPSQGSANRYLANGDASHHSAGANCIASECMAWRWDGWFAEQVIPPNATMDWEPTLTKMQPKGDAGAKHMGHCGLAGKP